jgi:hypothetical protein
VWIPSGGPRPRALLVPKRVGKASKTPKHSLHNGITKISFSLNIQKNNFLID